MTVEFDILMLSDFVKKLNQILTDFGDMPVSRHRRQKFDGLSSDYKLNHLVFRKKVIEDNYYLLETSNVKGYEHLCMMDFVLDGGDVVDLSKGNKISITTGVIKIR